MVTTPEPDSEHGEIKANSSTRDVILVMKFFDMAAQRKAFDRSRLNFLYSHVTAAVAMIRQIEITS